MKDGRPVAPMRSGDSLICFNYRADRMRQIIATLTQSDFAGFDVSGRPSLTLATMTAYDRRIRLPVAFPPQSMANIVGEVVSKAGMRMLRHRRDREVRHVTYFFNGGVEDALSVRGSPAGAKPAGGDVRPDA